MKSMPSDGLPNFGLGRFALSTRRSVRRVETCLLGTYAWRQSQTVERSNHFLERLVTVSPEKTMPLTLNVGLTKKMGLPDYGSLGASCHVEVELDGSLLQCDLDGFHRHV